MKTDAVGYNFGEKYRQVLARHKTGILATLAIFFTYLFVYLLSVPKIKLLLALKKFLALINDTFING